MYVPVWDAANHTIMINRRIKECSPQWMYDDNGFQVHSSSIPCIALAAPYGVADPIITHWLNIPMSKFIGMKITEVEEFLKPYYNNPPITEQY